MKINTPSGDSPLLHQTLQGPAPNPAGKPSTERKRRPLNKRRLITAEDYERERKRKVEVQLVHLRDELEEQDQYVREGLALLRIEVDASTQWEPVFWSRAGGCG